MGTEVLRRLLPPDAPGSRAAAGALVLAGLLSGCSASFGSGGPSVDAVPAVGERDPGRTDESLREQRLRDVLQALFRAEQRYHNDTGTYTDEVYALRGDGGSGSAFQVPAGVRLRIPEATATGFAGVADRRRSSARCTSATRVRRGATSRPRA